MEVDRSGQFLRALLRLLPVRNGDGWRPVRIDGPTFVGGPPLSEGAFGPRGRAPS